MKKTTACCLFLIVTAITATAQFDSTYFDLGRTSLKKDFTQHITIKGRDLENMPFTNLAEAVAVYFNGAYTYPEKLLYVIDGILVTDANAYPIYDIEEITLVQNALITTNGSGKQQQLVLVTTKRNHAPGKSLMAASQTFLATSDFDNPGFSNQTKSQTGFFHQYQVSGSLSGKKIQAGISANYLRDIFPPQKDNDFVYTKTPYNFSRFRLRGSMQAQIGKIHRLQLQLAFIPETAKGTDARQLTSTEAVGSDLKRKQTAWNPALQFYSTLSKNWLNEFQVAYQYARSKTNANEVSVYNNGAPETASVLEGHDTIKNFVISDRITFRKQWNNWTLEPSLNLQYRDMKMTNGIYSATIQNGAPTGYIFITMQQKGRWFLITPVVSVAFRNAFHLQGGVLVNASKNTGMNSKRVFPFVDVMADVLKLANPSTGWSLQLFGSRAESEFFNEQPFRYKNYGRDVLSFLNTMPYTITPGTGLLYVYNPDYTPVNTFLQTGLRLATKENRFALQYNFDNRDYYDLLLVPVPAGSGYDYGLSNVRIVSEMHRLGISGQLLATPKWEWFSGLHATSLTIKLKNGAYTDWPLDQGGVITSSNDAITGGWANRFRFNHLSFGVNLLYILRESRKINNVSQGWTNSFLLQNVYLGYRFKAGKINNLELFAAWKNVAQSDQSLLADNRKYAGLGVKAQF